MKGLPWRRPGRSLHERFRDTPNPLPGRGATTQDAFHRLTSGFTPECRYAPPTENRYWNLKIA